MIAPNAFCDVLVRDVNHDICDKILRQLVVSLGNFGLSLTWFDQLVVAARKRGETGGCKLLCGKICLWKPGKFASYTLPSFN